MQKDYHTAVAYLEIIRGVFMLIDELDSYDIVTDDNDRIHLVPAKFGNPELMLKRNKNGAWILSNT